MDLKQAREVLEIWGDYPYITHRENQFVSALRAAIAEVDRLNAELDRAWDELLAVSYLALLDLPVNGGEG